jgi:hypothetical protein
MGVLIGQARFIEYIYIMYLDGIGDIKVNRGRRKAKMDKFLNRSSFS